MTEIQIDDAGGLRKRRGKFLTWSFLLGRSWFLECWFRCSTQLPGCTPNPWVCLKRFTPSPFVLVLGSGHFICQLECAFDDCGRKVGTDCFEALDVKCDSFNQACVFGANQQSKRPNQGQSKSLGEFACCKVVENHCRSALGQCQAENCGFPGTKIPLREERRS